jgi:hypothetical protein
LNFFNQKNFGLELLVFLKNFYRRPRYFGPIVQDQFTFFFGNLPSTSCQTKKKSKTSDNGPETVAKTFNTVEL